METGLLIVCCVVLIVHSFSPVLPGTCIQVSYAAMCLGLFSGSSEPSDHLNPVWLVMCLSVICFWWMPVPRNRENLKSCSESAVTHNLCLSLSFIFLDRKHALNCHRMKPALFSVLCEIKERSGKLSILLPGLGVYVQKHVRSWAQMILNLFRLTNWRL